MTTLFSKIIAGEIPCHRVYEDPWVLAFLDIAPLSVGHTLLIPKRPARVLTDLDEASAEALGRALPKVAKAVLAATGATAFNVLQNNEAEAGQSVFHVHFHIIPKPSPDAGVGLRWPAKPADPALLKELAQSIAQALGSSV